MAASSKNTFTVDGFTRDAKAAIRSAETVKDQQLAVKALMMKVYAENDTDTIVDRLNEAVPPGASLAEMILFADDDVTLLWGQVPPRFQSAVHNHTIWANIQPIIGTYWFASDLAYAIPNNIISLLHLSIPFRTRKEYHLRGRQIW